MPTYQRRPTLTITLLALVIGLLTTTVAMITYVDRRAARQLAGDFQERSSGYALLALGTWVGAQLAPAQPLLAEGSALARLGRLQVTDGDALGDYLVERLRHEPRVDRLYYGDQRSGRFVIASRLSDGSGIVLGVSQPDLEAGRRLEWLVAAEGALEPLDRDPVVGFDPRQRGWYQQATAANDLVWTDPYTFPDGTLGLTAALAWREPGAADARGVFGVDFRLADLSSSLASFVQGRSRVRSPQIAVLTRQGQLVATAGVPTAGPGASALSTALQQSREHLATLSLERGQTFQIDAGGSAWFTTLSAYRVAPGLEWVITVIVPLDEYLETLNESLRQAGLVVLGILAVASTVGLLISHRITRPLQTIATELERIGRFELSDTPAPHSFVREIDVVGTAVDRMKASLRSFARYVPRQLVQDVLASGEEARLGGQSRVLSLYFSDVAGFTSISETMPPGELVEYLGEYLQAMTTIIEGHQGTVDKFIGDGILALFNAPRTVEHHAAAACLAALRSQECLRDLRPHWLAQGRQPMRARIGLHTGEVIVGNIGTPDRFEYTVTGDAVNLASRLEGLSKLYGSEILASEDLRVAAGPGLEWRTLDRVAVVGRQSGTLVNELLGVRGTVELAVLRARDQYELGLAAYFRRDFDQAVELFRLASETWPEDKAGSVLAARAEELRRNPPAADWDGMYHATSK